MTRIVSYSGKEPTVVLPEGVCPAKVMELLEEQIKVLKALTTQVVMIPEGTRISEHDLSPSANTIEYRGKEFSRAQLIVAADTAMSRLCSYTARDLIDEMLSILGVEK